MATSTQATRQHSHLDIPGQSSDTSPPSTSNRPHPPTTISRTATSQRLPPPTLFQGPPSKNASHISLALPDHPNHHNSPPPLNTITSDDGKSPTHVGNPRASRIPPAASFSGNLPGANPSTANPTSRASLRQPALNAKPADTFQAESLWAEMQKTLADVELSAMNPSHVFGASHARALEDLRASQLQLAQAWAKSESEGVGEYDDGGAGEGVVGGGGVGGARKEEKGDGKAEAEKSEFSNNKNLEDETERDIMLARRRREANDRYFEQVNRGVVDVVGRLDVVAGAMRRVEKESREIWDASEQEESGSATEDSVVGAANTTEDGEVSPSLVSGSPESARSRFSRR